MKIAQQGLWENANAGKSREHICFKLHATRGSEFEHYDTVSVALEPSRALPCVEHSATLWRQTGGNLLMGLREREREWTRNLGAPGEFAKGSLADL
eukprot:4935160-Amphidinium_carterae.1